MPTVPSEGWGVLHLFFHFRRAMLEDPVHAAGDFVQRVKELDSREDYQVIPFSVLGQKADFGLMLLGPDLDVLDAFATELPQTALGAGLAPAASYVSLTEGSEYTSTTDDERARLAADGVAPDSPDMEEKVAAFETRMAEYMRHRLYPDLPRKKVIGFYPMSKKRDVGANWYQLPFEQRKAIMAGHAKVGRSYRGRVLQLITGSTGLDDWEWGVTLFVDDPATLKEIVYEMRFDEASAAYADFGPFVTGLVMEPEQLMRRLGLQG